MNTEPHAGVRVDTVIRIMLYCGKLGTSQITDKMVNIDITKSW